MFREPNNASKTVKLTLEKIYKKYLKDYNAPKTISINSSNSNSNIGLNDPIVAKNEASLLHDAIVNAGRMSREDINRHRKQNQDKRASFERKSNGGNNPNCYYFEWA